MTSLGRQPKTRSSAGDAHRIVPSSPYQMRASLDCAISISAAPGGSGSIGGVANLR